MHKPSNDASSLAGLGLVMPCHDRDSLSGQVLALKVWFDQSSADGVVAMNAAEADTFSHALAELATRARQAELQGLAAAVDGHLAALKLCNAVLATYLRKCGAAS